MSGHPEETSLSDSLDAPADALGPLRAHVADCVRCRETLAVIERGRSQAATLRRPVEPPPQVFTGALAKLAAGLPRQTRAAAWRLLRVPIAIGALLLIGISSWVTLAVSTRTAGPADGYAHWSELPLVPVREADVLARTYAERERVLLRRIAAASGASSSRGVGLIASASARLAELQAQITDRRALPAQLDLGDNSGAALQRLYDERLLVLQALLSSLASP